MLHYHDYTFNYNKNVITMETIPPQHNSKERERARVRACVCVCVFVFYKGFP